MWTKFDGFRKLRLQSPYHLRWERNPFISLSPIAHTANSVLLLFWQTSYIKYKKKEGWKRWGDNTEDHSQNSQKSSQTINFNGTDTCSGVN